MRFSTLCLGAAFLAAQCAIIWIDANGPFVDEGLFVVSGLRVLEGHGRADGYIAWFNGSPFVWPVLAALGQRVGGLAGARLVAALLSTVTLLAFAGTAERLFGRSSARWSTLALGLNGLFLALAHFAVYDVAALTGLAVSLWCVTHPTGPRAWPWMLAAALAFSGAVIAKYGYAATLLPLVGVALAVRGAKGAGRALAPFLAVIAVILASYFWLSFGSLVPTSSAAYLGQTFGRSRGHIAVLQLVFGAAPAALAAAGAVVAWRRGQRLLVAACLLALTLAPAFHLWTANFVSAQKHVVAGFLFAYLLAGVALDRLWTSGARVTAIGLVTLLATWGGLQCYWQDRSWSDTRPLAEHLAAHLAPGDRVLAESSWSYTVYLYPRGLIASPAAVIDANFAPDRDRLDVCAIPWWVGNPDSAELIRRALGRCPHARVMSTSGRHYYVDTSRLQPGVHTVVVGLYRRPGS